LKNLTAAHNTTRLTSIRQTGVVECTHSTAPGCVINRHRLGDCVRRDDHSAHNRCTVRVCGRYACGGVCGCGIECGIGCGSVDRCSVGNSSVSGGSACNRRIWLMVLAGHIRRHQLVRLGNTANSAGTGTNRVASAVCTTGGARVLRAVALRGAHLGVLAGCGRNITTVTTTHTITSTTRTSTTTSTTYTISLTATSRRQVGCTLNTSTSTSTTSAAAAHKVEQAVVNISLHGAFGLGAGAHGSVQVTGSLVCPCAVCLVCSV